MKVQEDIITDVWNNQVDIADGLNEFADKRAQMRLVPRITFKPQMPQTFICGICRLVRLLDAKRKMMKTLQRICKQLP